MADSGPRPQSVEAGLRLFNSAITFYRMWMSAKPSPNVPGIDFLVDALGRRKSVVIDLRRHRALWEDIYDAYLAGKRRNEPRESVAKVRKLIESPPKRRTRGNLSG